MTTDTIQILELYKQGANAEQIGLALCKSPEAVAMVIAANVDNKRKQTLTDKFGDLKQIAIETLKEVAALGENESARVSAAKILLDEADGNNGHGGIANKFDYQQIAERLIQAENAVKPIENLVKLEVVEKREKLVNSKVKEANEVVNKVRAIEKEKEEPMEFEVVA